MTEETAKLLAEAMNRLAAALEALPRGLGGINVTHTGLVQQMPWPQQPYPPDYYNR